MSDNNCLRAALANAHNALELYHAYGWPDRLGVRAALRVQIDALAATQQPAPSAPEQIIESLGQYDAAVKLAQSLGYMWRGGEWAAPEQPSAAADVDALAQFIRSIDGWSRMGAGVLAEHICEWIATTPKARAKASIAAIHCRLAHGGGITEGTRLALLDECEHAAPELKALRTPAPAAQGEAVAVVGDCFSLLWLGGNSFAEHAQRHGIKVGTKLYTHAAPERAEVCQVERQVRHQLGRTMELVLIRGLPGSGKTTMARVLAMVGYEHHEADHYFERDGAYHLDAAELPKAHAWCLERARDSMARRARCVVANTFTRRWEMQPYMDAATAAGVPVRVIEAHGAWENCHGVPSDAIERMRERWELVDAYRGNSPAPERAEVRPPVRALTVDDLDAVCNGWLASCHEDDYTADRQLVRASIVKFCEVNGITPPSAADSAQGEKGGA